MDGQVSHLLQGEQSHADVFQSLFLPLRMQVTSEIFVDFRQAFVTGWFCFSKLPSQHPLHRTPFFFNEETRRLLEEIIHAIFRLCTETFIATTANYLFSGVRGVGKTEFLSRIHDLCVLLCGDKVTTVFLNFDQYAQMLPSAAIAGPDLADTPINTLLMDHATSAKPVVFFGDELQALYASDCHSSDPRVLAVREIVAIGTSERAMCLLSGSSSEVASVAFKQFLSDSETVKGHQYRHYPPLHETIFHHVRLEPLRQRKAFQAFLYDCCLSDQQLVELQQRLGKPNSDVNSFWGRLFAKTGGLYRLIRQAMTEPNAFDVPTLPVAASSASSSAPTTPGTSQEALGTPPTASHASGTFRSSSTSVFTAFCPSYVVSALRDISKQLSLQEILAELCLMNRDIAPSALPNRTPAATSAATGASAPPAGAAAAAAATTTTTTTTAAAASSSSSASSSSAAASAAAAQTVVYARDPFAMRGVAASAAHLMIKRHMQHQQYLQFQSSVSPLSASHSAALQHNSAHNQQSVPHFVTGHPGAGWGAFSIGPQMGASSVVSGDGNQAGGDGSKGQRTNQHHGGNLPLGVFPTTAGGILTTELSYGSGSSLTPGLTPSIIHDWIDSGFLFEREEDMQTIYELHYPGLFERLMAIVPSLGATLPELWGLRLLFATGVHHAAYALCPSLNRMGMEYLFKLLLRASNSGLIPFPVAKYRSRRLCTARTVLKSDLKSSEMVVLEQPPSRYTKSIEEIDGELLSCTHAAGVSGFVINLHTGKNAAGGADPAVAAALSSSFLPASVHLLRVLPGSFTGFIEVKEALAVASEVEAEARALHSHIRSRITKPKPALGFINLVILSARKFTDEAVVAMQRVFASSDFFEDTFTVEIVDSEAFQQLLPEALWNALRG
ncbi:hypothetical protein, variant [Capsaspora owczarzaki ATCC 30864]|nr:hypothetical protein, variant [Capsaspora owczarzaki ATCC 30864]